MSLFVFVTEACRNEARNHGFLDRLNSFVSQVTKAQSLAYFDKDFPPPYLVKRKFGNRQGRLIARLEQVDAYDVVVLLGILIRGSNEYESGFGPDPEGYGRSNFERRYSREKLEKFVREELQRNKPPEKEQPSEDEYGYIYPEFSKPDYTELVCETGDWVEAFRNDFFSDYISHFTAPVRDLLSPKNKALQSATFLELPQKRDLGFVFRIWPEHKTCMLISPTRTNDPNFNRQSVEQRHVGLLKGRFENRDEVRQRSRRAYPSYVLWDDDEWLRIQKDREGNLALSSEEEAILESVMLGAQNQPPFPLFINGRAGSGKTTVLQYLFAQYLFRYLSAPACDGAKPLYFTCSPGLLERSRQMVECIIMSDARMLEAAGNADRRQLVNDNRHRIAECFQDFHQYLTKAIATLKEEDRRRFDPSKRVTYATFVRRWQERFLRTRHQVQEYGPDLSWHVIRCYIKGFSADELIDPAEYPQIQRKQRTVTSQTYKEIYDHVWTGWYQRLCDGEGFWDDQDLARALLENDAIRPCALAVFCDEAQDFTRLELEILLRLSVFSSRRLDGTEVRRVPFAFAGDEFQTLNPTGFRWDSIKAMFVEKFIFALDSRAGQGNVELNYRPLCYNYRSSPHIVLFSNGIQALRRKLFSANDVVPQRAWRTDNLEPSVFWIPREDADTWQAIRNQKDIKIIVPCHEGEEAEYVQKDPCLIQYVDFRDGVPVNVYSAVRAKGLEFDRVAVYGFGEQCPENLFRVAGEDDDPERAREQTLPNEYFINRVYVAVTRARKSLFIIDSTSGLDRLWKLLKDDASLEKILPVETTGGLSWHDFVKPMYRGNAQYIQSERPADRLEEARQLEERGKQRRDDYEMFQAAFAYDAVGQKMKATECRAYGYLFSKNKEYLRAGECFLECEKIDEAVSAFWAAGSDGRDRILRLGENRAAIQDRIEWRLAKFLAAPSHKLAEVVSVLESLRDKLRGEKFLNDVMSDPQPWRSAVEQVFESLTDATEPSPDHWSRLASLTDSDEFRPLRIQSLRPMAKIYYEVREFSKAKEFYEKAGATACPEYQKCKADVEPYPAKLDPLAELKMWDRIVEEFDKHKAKSLNAHQMQLVAQALIELGRVSDAVASVPLGLDTNMLRSIVKQGDAEHDTVTALRVMHLFAINSVRAKDWRQLLSIMKSDHVPQPFDRSKTCKQLWGQHKDDIGFSAVRVLAVETNLDKHLEGPSLEELAKHIAALGKKRSPDSASWRVFGAALERTHRYQTTMDYYAHLLKVIPENQEEERTQVRIRYLTVKRRLAKWQAASKKGEMRSAGTVTSLEVTREWEKFKLPSEATVPEYPEAPPFERVVNEIAALELPGKSAAAKPSAPPETGSPEPSRTGGAASVLTDPCTSEVGQIKLEIYRSKGRINLTNKNSAEQAAVKILQGVVRVEGEGNFRETLPGGEWRSKDWGVQITIVEKENTHAVRVRSEAENLSLEIQM